MEEEYWKRFFETGKIKDYLYYKGMGICRQVMESYDLLDGVRPPGGHLTQPKKGVDYGSPRWY